MVEMTKAANQAAHVFIDMVSTHDLDAGAELNVSAMNLAAERINETDAVKATLHDDESVTIDISDLVGGVIIPMKWLIGSLALERGISEEEIIQELRELLDE